jgi:hypothetical protein
MQTNIEQKKNQANEPYYKQKNALEKYYIEYEISQQMWANP